MQIHLETSVVDVVECFFCRNVLDINHLSALILVSPVDAAGWQVDPFIHLDGKRSFHVRSLNRKYHLIFGPGLLGKVNSFLRQFKWSYNFNVESVSLFHR